MEALLPHFLIDNDDNQPQKLLKHSQNDQYHVLLPYFRLLDAQNHYLSGSVIRKTDHHKQEDQWKPPVHQIPIRNGPNYFLKSVQLLFLTPV
jgi:hypothetical protein